MSVASFKATSWGRQGLQAMHLWSSKLPRCGLQTRACCALSPDKYSPAPSTSPHGGSLLPFLPVSCLCGLGRLRGGGRAVAQARRPDSVNIYSQAQEAISFLFLLLIERGESGCNTSKGLKAQPKRPAELGRRGERECFINAAAAASPEGKCIFLFAARQCLPSRLPYRALHYAFPFHLGACLKERGKEGKEPHKLLLITNLFAAVA